ncbi:MAG TPA: EthD family reductase [Terriglobales bacterium]|nr:EthD family reductase [Terriglobales bacterium]
MLFVTVTYANQDGAKFDFDYYMKKHIPMVAGLLGTTIEVCKGIATPMGTPVAFLCVARIRINSIEEFSAAMAKHGPQITQDVANYSNVQPTVQIDEEL